MTETSLVGGDHLRASLWECFKAGEFVDLTMECASSVTFKVHKNVICSQSPVFKAMLQNSCKESVEATIRLPDDNIAAFKSAIYWCYTNDIGSDVDEAWALDTSRGFSNCAHLYIFADKYAMSRLRDEIAGAFAETLSRIDQLLPEKPASSDQPPSSADWEGPWCDVLESFRVIARSTLPASDDPMRKLVVERVRRYGILMNAHGPEDIRSALDVLLEDVDLNKDIIMDTLRNLFIECGSCYNIKPGHTSTLTCRTCAIPKKKQQGT